MTGVGTKFVFLALSLLTLVNAGHLLRQKQLLHQQQQALQTQTQQDKFTTILTEDCNTAGVRNGGAVALGGVCTFVGESKQYDDLGAISLNGVSSTFLAWASWSEFRSWSRIYDCGWVLLSNTNTDNGVYLEAQYWLQIVGALPTNQWVLLVATLNAQTNTQYLYLNGGTQSSSSTGTPFPAIVGCRLGLSNWDVDAGFSGLIDRFDIIPSLLAPSDVKNIYNIAVSGLSYSPSSSAVALSTSVSFVPTVTYASQFGGGTTYTISPALPVGITLNPLTGVISGSSAVGGAATQYTIIGKNAGGQASAVITLQVGAAGASPFTWDGTAAGAGALTQLVVYTTAAGVVGLKATFGGYVSAVVGLASGTAQTITIQPGEFVAKFTSWFSATIVTGIQVTTSLGKIWGPYGLSAGNGDTQVVAGQALVIISGSATASNLIYPLKFTWSAGPTGTAPFGTISGGAFNVASPRQSGGNCAPSLTFVPVQTVTFFLYTGPGTAVPNYISGMSIAVAGVTSVIVGPPAFSWPDTTGTITTQTVVIPPNDYLNRWDIVTCNIAPGSNQMCGVTITSSKGVVWNVGTTTAQATAANAAPYLVPLNYLQNAPSCAFRGIYGNYQTLTQNGHTISFIPGALVE